MVRNLETGIHLFMIWNNLSIVCYGGFAEDPTIEPFDPATIPTAIPVPAKRGDGHMDTPQSKIPYEGKASRNR